MEKVIIKNRKEQKIVIVLEQTDNAKGLAFIMHGLGGRKEQPHIATFAEAFREKGFTVVRFDTTNSYGESEGKYEDATITNYLQDLEDVIAWAKQQSWYQEPFYLVGHSLGGICTTLFAEHYPEQVKGLAPISTVVSGKLRAALHGEKELKEWEQAGIKRQESKSVPGRIKHLKWNHMVDQMPYDILPEAQKLTMPALLIVGDHDNLTPLSQQQLFFDALQTAKELHVIKGAEHDFVTPEELAQIKEIFLQWIEKVETSGSL